jgi:hypothetical protein
MSNMIRKILLIATICSLSSGILSPGQASAMLPLGNDAHRHFYRDQEWIWTASNSPESIKPGTRGELVPAVPTDPEKTDVAFTMPTHPSQASLAFTMPTHPAQANVAFTMPTHPSQASLAFTMPTHPSQADLAFTMPTHPLQADLAFTMPTHPSQTSLAFTMPAHPSRAKLSRLEQFSAQEVA